MTAAFDFSPFRDAGALTWHQHTVWAPHRSDDGTLITNTGYQLPVDTYTPAEFRPPREVGQNLLEEGAGFTVGIAVVDAATLDDTRKAVRDWCREHVGRDDVTFED